MFPSHSRTPVIRALATMIAAAVGCVLAFSPSHAQEQQQRWQLFRTPPENARAVWFAQARQVSSQLELERQASRQVTRVYASARQEHLDKVKALPETREAFQQFMEITAEAQSALEKALVEAVGEEKGKKAAAALGGFSFFFDNMMADVLAVQDKAVGGLLQYQEVFNKAFQEAREAGSFEGVREKLEAPTQELRKGASAIYSEEQIGKWQEKYGWFFERMLSP